MAPQPPPLRAGAVPRDEVTPSWRCFWRSWFSASRGFALLTAFATSITASSVHRNFASLDASARTAIDTAIADIQQQAGSATNNPFTCPNNFTPTFPSLTGTFQVTYTVA